jgi:hypothetical protein
MANSFENLNGISERSAKATNNLAKEYGLPIPQATLQTIPTERNWQIIASTFGLPILKAAIYRATQSLEDGTIDLKAKRLSQLSTPVQVKLKLNGGSYKDAKGKLIDYPSELQESIILETVLIEINQTKNIITTNIQGRDGSVKEYINDGDYDIVIRGIINSDAPYIYPNDEVQTLHKFLLVKSHIDVSGTNFLDFFGIERIVVTDYSFPQREGLYNSQAFEIRALSDIDYDLKIK